MPARRRALTQPGYCPGGRYFGWQTESGRLSLSASRLAYEVLAAGSLEPDGELVDTLGVVDAVRPVRPADEAETGTPGAPRLDVAPQVVAQLVGFDPDEGSELPLDRRSSLGADHGQSGADTSDGDFPRSTGRTR